MYSDNETMFYARRYGMKITMLFLMVCLTVFCYAQNSALQTTATLNPELIDIDTFDPAAQSGEDAKTIVTKGYEAYNKGEYETAAKYYLVYLKSNQEDATSWYNLSCCYGLLNKPALAAKYLKVAYKAGFTDTNHIAKDTDFDKIRTDGDFSNTVDSLKIWNERKSYYAGKMEYFPAKSYLPYWIHLPKNFDSNKAYTLLIGLHGFGDKAHSFTYLWKQAESEDVIFVVPEAPYGFVEGKDAGFSWMPFVPYESKTAEIAFDWVNDYIINLTKEIRSKYKIKQTWLMGFSQGAYSGYMLAFRNPKVFTGLIACGGGLMTEAITDKDFKASRKMHVIISHGKQDKVVAFEEGQKAYDLLKAKGFDVVLQDFEGGHSVSPEAFKLFQEKIK